MCGIAGIVALAPGAASPARVELERMLGALQHRGPDESGLYRDARAGLAHTRLSIIDLSGGAQPLCNEDETLWIAFNGEIFNYLELREELVGRGHVFRTSSDTEVIVHAYEEWGEQAFPRMNGQWAVALWDARAQRLVVTRDRLGVRPLYLCAHAGRLYFASEVKAIFAADASIPRAFDPVGLEQTFTFWSIVPPQSVFAGIEELRPGHVRIYEDGVVREGTYWTPHYRREEDRTGGSLDEAVGETRDALENAVKLRMLRADVPVGSYLSGGLDSSIVAALGQKYARGSFQTYSLRFEDAEYDETIFQRQMAESIESDHHELVVSRDDIATVFPDVIHHTERPILRTAPAPLFLLSQLVQGSGIKVVLTGEGADEVFAGYDLFREGKVRRFWARQPESKLRPRLLERLYPYLARSPVAQQAMARRFFGRRLEEHASPGFAHHTRWDGTAALKRLLSRPVREAVGAKDVVGELLADLPADLPSWTPLAQDQYLETRTLLAGYLLSSQGDRVLMAHSVEGRFPFLDRDVVELANGLPASYKLRVLDEKHILKRAAGDIVPEGILARKKQPYRAPDALSFLGPAAGYADEVLAPHAVADAGVFEPAGVTQLWQKCRATGGAQLSNTDNMALVGVLSTQLLHHGFIRNRPTASRSFRLRVDIDRNLRHPQDETRR
jgi:asparagine synthase (glutamine-hydrolysing)